MHAVERPYVQVTTPTPFGPDVRRFTDKEEADRFVESLPDFQRLGMVVEDCP